MTAPVVESVVQSPNSGDLPGIQCVPDVDCCSRHKPLYGYRRHALENVAAALIASDYVVVPLAPDMFSLQGLHNVGPTLKTWRKAWKERMKQKPSDLEIDLPSGDMRPLGYVIMRHAIRLDRPVRAFNRWIEKIPGEYTKSVMGEERVLAASNDDDGNRLAHLKDYHSLMPMAQEANKPMFMLKPADGVIGAHQSAVQRCYGDFQELAHNVLDRLGVRKDR